MSWNFSSGSPLYTQIVEHMVNGILGGKYAMGEKLPSVRDLAVEAAVNPNTMQKALSELEKCGLVITHRNSGRTVTENDEAIESARDLRAQETITDFLQKMKSLGFSTNQTITLIEKAGGDFNG